MAMPKYGSAKIVGSDINLEQWSKSACCGKKGNHSCGKDDCRVKIAKSVFAKYSPEKFLLSHCTIIAAVDVELADPSNPKSDYYIHPSYSSLVNNNGDAWTKKVLSSFYRSFVGAHNYLEHVQIPELSKGRVVDAILREVPIGKDSEGKELTTYYVDILVATEKKHKDLVAKIKTGEIDSMSMGCKIQFSICSKCGNRAVDETEACNHVRYEKNNMFYDDNGVQRKIAELCGHHEILDSVVFIDASWVKKPAFTGAVIRNTVDPPEDILAKIEEASAKEGYVVQESDFLKAAQKETPTEEESAEPEDDVSPEPPPDEKTPPDEEAIPPMEEPPQDKVKTWKDEIKKQVLQELGDELVQEFTEEDDSGARELETLDESLIQPTASRVLKQMWVLKEGWNNFLKKTANGLCKEKFNRLKFGTFIMLNSDDPKILIDYGYNRRDFLAVLSFIDQCFKGSLSLDVKKAIANLNGSKGLTEKQASFSLQKLAGRKLSSKEITKSLAWLRLMDSYR